MVDLNKIMRHLNTFNETLLSDAIEYISDLTSDLFDNDFIINIYNGSKSTPTLFKLKDHNGDILNYNFIGLENSISISELSKYVYIIIYKIKEVDEIKRLKEFDKNDINLIDDFNKALINYKIWPSISSGGSGFRLFYLSKKRIYNSLI